jgi:predicted DCC family thiol-disulfide oxidoreductase YuxK
MNGLPMTPATLIFDGDCGLCTAVARWAERGWRVQARAVSSQSVGKTGLAEFGLTTEQAAALVWWVGADGHAVGGHLAVSEALKAGGALRRVVGRAITSLPATRIAQRIYSTVARNRHKFPGGTDACRPSEHRGVT